MNVSGVGNVQRLQSDKVDKIVEKFERQEIVYELAHVGGGAADAASIGNTRCVVDICVDVAENVVITDKRDGVHADRIRGSRGSEEFEIGRRAHAQKRDKRG